MKRSNWRISQTLCGSRRGGRARVFAVAATLALLGNQHASLAEVTGQGDVSPTGPVNLPIGGGTIDADVIVGGTALPTAVTTVGTLTIDLPAFTEPLISNNGYIGNSADGIGQATVTGFLSEWLLKDVLSVGVNGQGYLNISTGAVIRTNIEGGFLADAFVGQFLGSQGFVTLSGIGTQMFNNQLAVGWEGTGSVTVQGGSWLRTTDSATLGTRSRTVGGVDAIGRGTVVVTGTGSRWNIAQELTVGVEGRGEVQVLAGGQLRAVRDVIIADEANSYGRTTVSGQGSQFWTERTLTVATTAGSMAEVYVNDQGMLRADTSITLGRQAYLNMAGGTVLTPSITNGGIIRGSGTINGAVTNNGDIRTAASIANTRERLLFTGAVTNNDNIESFGGELEFNGDVTNNAPNGEIIAEDAILRFYGPNGLVNNGKVWLDDTVLWSTNFVNNGTLKVYAGQSSTISSNLTLSSTSMLQMNLGDDYSKLWVTGTADLGGILSLSLASDYTPQMGDSFEILRSSSLGGSTFDGVISPGTLWNVTYPGDSVFVTYAGIATPGIGADFNNDNIVNSLDLEIWEMYYGVGMNPPPLATQSQGDANGDGKVDGADYMIIQRQLGGPPVAIPASGGSIVGVPEPSSLVLAAAAFGLPLAARRRRK